MISNRLWRVLNTLLLFVGFVLVSNQEVILANVPEDQKLLALVVILGFREYLKDARSNDETVDEDAGDEVA